jgi:hypothetical protein
LDFGRRTLAVFKDDSRKRSVEELQRLTHSETTMIEDLCAVKEEALHNLAKLLISLGRSQVTQPLLSFGFQECHLIVGS